MEASDDESQLEEPEVEADLMLDPVSQAARVSPFLSELQVLAWSHVNSGDVRREDLPQQLYRDHKGALGLIGKSAEQIEVAIKPYKTIINSAANVHPLVSHHTFEDKDKKQLLAWVRLPLRRQHLQFQPPNN